jgi:hypothetical protein
MYRPGGYVPMWFKKTTASAFISPCGLKVNHVVTKFEPKHITPYPMYRLGGYVPMWFKVYHNLPDLAKRVLC